VTRLPQNGTPLGVGGHRVSRVSFDHAISLLTDGGAQLTFETEFEMCGVWNSSVVQVVPEAAAEQAPALLSLLLRESIHAAQFYSDGVLELRAGAVLLRTSPHEQYEAWTFAGPGGEKVVCLPGGGVATWGLAAE
jgi:hypothetical protein